MFDRGIGYRAELEPPASIGDLRQYVDRTKTAKPGCLYTGPTRIKFLPTSGSATPKMQVWSKFTDRRDAELRLWHRRHRDGSARPPGRPDGDRAERQPGPGAGRPRGAGLARLRRLHRRRHRHRRRTARADTTREGNGYPYLDWNLNDAEANCRYGTVYLEGQLKGRLTVAADNNMVRHR